MIADFPRVMTLDETAEYLRLPSTMIEKQAVYGRIPGRRIENKWRFLRDALDDWLRAQDSRVILLQQAGALADDDQIEPLLDEIYAERGRSEVEPDS